MAKNRDLYEMAAEVRARAGIYDVISRVVTLTERRKGDWWGCCPFHGEKTASFHCGQRHGYYCFGCGAHGDVIAFVMAVTGRGFKEAVRDLAEELGLMPPPDGQAPRPLADLQPRPSKRKALLDTRAYVEWCRAKWDAAVPAAGTLVEVYLRSRGITMAPPPTLRFAMLRHSESGLVLPCMVAAVQAVDRTVVGIHRTFLRDDGTGKALVTNAKKMAGIMRGSAIRLAPVAARLASGEGIETCLSVMQESGIPTWAAGSLGNLAGEAPSGPKGKMTPHPTRAGVMVPSPRPDLTRRGVIFPAEVTDLLLLGDGDSDPVITRALMTRAERRYRAEARRVNTAWADDGKDFNDMLCGGAA